jgi:hypothetical protein
MFPKNRIYYQVERKKLNIITQLLMQLLPAIHFQMIKIKKTSPKANQLTRFNKIQNKSFFTVSHNMGWGLFFNLLDFAS